MFNSQFDSFQRTIATAKEEREQLDRLLTISTPKERLLVGATVAVCVLFIIWLWFGSIPYNLKVNGVLIEPEVNANSDNESIQALIWLNSNRVSQLATGMPVTVLVDSANNTILTLSGKIAGISAMNMSAGIAQVISNAPIAVRQVDIDLETEFDRTILGNKGCQIIIQLDKRSPIVLFQQGLK